MEYLKNYTQGDPSRTTFHIKKIVKKFYYINGGTQEVDYNFCIILFYVYEVKS